MNFRHLTGLPDPIHRESDLSAEAFRVFGLDPDQYALDLPRQGEVRILTEQAAPQVRSAVGDHAFAGITERHPLTLGPVTAIRLTIRNVGIDPDSQGTYAVVEITDTDGNHRGLLFLTDWPADSPDSTVDGETIALTTPARMTPGEIDRIIADAAALDPVNFHGHTCQPVHPDSLAAVLLNSDGPDSRSGDHAGGLRLVLIGWPDPRR